MTDGLEARPRLRRELVARAAGGIVALVGGLVLVGWPVVKTIDEFWLNVVVLPPNGEQMTQPARPRAGEPSPRGRSWLRLS
jgi:hypothetical protein